MISLYQNIRLLRELNGLTQTELAHKCGYKDKSMIAKIEHGLIDLPISKIELIAAALDVPPNELLEPSENIISNLRYYKKYKSADDATKQVINRILDT